MDYRPNFGLGSIQQIDTLIIEWTNDKTTILTNIPTNQTITINRKKAIGNWQLATDNPQPATFQEITNNIRIPFQHQENRFVDFDRDRLIYHKISTDGPKIAKGDVNGDGLEDFYIGGAAGKSGALLIQQENATFIPSNERLFAANGGGEDTDCLFLDIDNDGDLDLYVGHGGNEFIGFNAQSLIDQLYINDGQGNFKKSPQFLPTFKGQSTSCVVAADYDNDGDQDLFVGTRVQAGYYGLSVNGHILNNNGQGKFKNITKQIAPGIN